MSRDGDPGLYQISGKPFLATHPRYPGRRQLLLAGHARQIHPRSPYEYLSNPQRPKSDCQQIGCPQPTIAKRKRMGYTRWNPAKSRPFAEVRRHVERRSLYAYREKSGGRVHRNVLAGLRRVRQCRPGSRISGPRHWFCGRRLGIRIDSADHGICHRSHLGMPLESGSLRGLVGGKTVSGFRAVPLCQPRCSAASPAPVSFM